MHFLQYCSILLFLLGINIMTNAQSQKELNLNTPQAAGAYVARDKIKLSQGFSAKSSSGVGKFALDSNITPAENYGSLLPSGIPNNQTTFTTSAEVGTIAGSADVSATGAATYQIPLSIPYGTGGMEPKLSVVYNSQAGNALLGKGWDLAGLSAISIVPKNKSFDYFEARLNDQGEGFAIDGQRLISTSGTYGSAGSVYSIEMMNFDRIEIPADGIGFIVKTKDGKILEYGTTTDARILGDVASSSVYVWRLNKAKDANGNYIKYEYGQENGESWVKTISYTGNDAGAAPYAQIQFLYDQRNDINTLFHSRGKFVQKRILSTINCKIQDQLIRKYDFVYAYNVTVTQLSEIKETGADGKSYNTTKIDWGMLARNIKTGASPSFFGNEESIIYNGDFDGNGINDCIAISKLYNTTNRYNWRYPDLLFGFAEGSSAWFYYEKNVLKASGGIPDVKNFVNMYPVDVDKDGKTELLALYQDNAFNSEHLINTKQTKNHVSVQLWNLDVVNKQFVTRTDTYGQKYNFYKTIWGTIFSQPTSLVLGDFDGNEEVDYLIKRPQDNSIADIVNFNTNVTANMIINMEKECGGTVKPYIDFDGDGMTDYVCQKLGSSDIIFPTTYRYYNAMIQYTGKLKVSNVIDYDGDGTSEIISLGTGNGGNSSTIYKLTPTGKVAVMTNIDEGDGGIAYDHQPNWRNIFGDFNGDGKTDILTYRRSDYNGHGIWVLRISNGLNYNDSKKLNLPNMSNVFSYWAAVPVDINLDGKQDIVLVSTDPGDNNKLTVSSYFYDGTNCILNTQIQLPNIGHGGISESLFLIDVPDNSGKIDSKLDLVYNYCYHYCNNSVLYFNQDEKADLVDKITDGFNNETIFSYDNLASAGVYTQNGPAQSLSNVRYLPPSALYVVTKLQLPNKPFYVNNESIFKYTGLLFHTEGRGVLGFAKIERTNLLTNHKVIQETAFDNYQPYINNTKTYTADGVTLLSTSTNTKTFVALNKILKVLEVNATNLDYLQNIRVETKETYNTDGNLSQLMLKTYDACVGGRLVYTKTVDNTFTQAGSYMPNVIDVSNLSVRYTDKVSSPTLSFVDVTRFTYNGKGNIITKTEFYGKPNAITVTFGNWDIYGTPRSFTTMAADVLPKTIKNELDITGRFVTKIYNPYNQYTSKTYDNMGNVLSETGIDGNKLIHTYDGFGRLKSTFISATSSVVNRDIAWETNEPGTLYKTRTTSQGQPTTYTYYDALGRNIKSTTESFGKTSTNTIVKTNFYNPDGTLLRESQPYYINTTATIKYTNYAYDNYKRIVGIQKTGFNVNTFQRNTPRTTVTTDQTGNKTTQVVNALGKIISSTDKNNQTVTYEYDERLNVVKTTAVGVVTQMGYDIYGRQNSLTDLNAGTITYKYDSYGRLYEQKDILYLSKFYYDLLDRLTSKTVGDETITYTYVASGNGVNNVLSETSSKGSVTSYEYNNLGKVITLTTTITGETYTTRYVYDAQGKEIKHIYPSTFATENVYDNIGNVTKVIRADGNNKDVIWELNELTALGQVKAYTLGKSGKVFTNTYTNDFLSSSIVIDATTTSFQASYTIEPNSGNMTQRTINGVSETFAYDNLNRLTTINFTPPLTNTAIAINYTGNGNGNIDSKSDVGTYAYNAKPHAVASIKNQTAQVPTTTQTIVYDAYGKVSAITDFNPNANTYHSYLISYGTDHERNKMLHINSANSADSYVRYYATSYEKNVYNNNTQHVHYINTPMGVTAVYIKDNTANNDKIFHLLADHQGTISTILSETGQIVENNYYDAWGRKRRHNKITGVLSYTVIYGLLARGYTGHEHLLEIGLINMNGRLYDPMVGRMLSPDNFVQDPSNSQSYNRYSYCINNPLKYTDPSGQVFLADDILGAITLAAIFSATTYTFQIATSPGGFDDWNWESFVANAALGGAIGGLTFGIGQAAGQAIPLLSGYMTQTTARIIVGAGQMLAHGVVQGVMNMGSGGAFLQGFASGASSSLIGSIMGKSFGEGGMILAGAIGGGVANAVAGGDFARGFVEGAIVVGLNHAMHGAINNKITQDNATKQFIAIVAGESSNDINEAAAIGSVILNRLDNENGTLTDGFINKIGGAGQYDAIGGKIYNSIMSSSWDNILSPKNPYAIRISGAVMSLSGTDYSGGAYFWNSSSPRIGFNWNMYKNGTFAITKTIGATTFFKYSNTNKIWP